MARIYQISGPTGKLNDFLDRIRERPGVIGISRRRDESIDPEGDTLTIQTTNDGARDLMYLLGERVDLNEFSIVVTEPRSTIISRHAASIEAESSETTWEEMSVLLRQETNIDMNFVALMFLAGCIAGVGLWSNTLHIVVGSMLVAPGFEPLIRMPFGMLAGRKASAVAGLWSTVVGYVTMLIAGALVVWMLYLVDQSRGFDLQNRYWVRYWSSFSPEGVSVSIFAAAAGGFVIVGLKSVLTTGVMISLALIPSMTLVGMALSAGDVALAWGAFLRWLVDAVIVIIVGAFIFGMKMKFVHKRKGEE